MVSVKKSKPATAGKGSRKAKWAAEFDALFAKLKKLSRYSKEFTDTLDRLQDIGLKAGHDRYESLHNAMPGLLDPELAEHVKNLNEWVACAKESVDVRFYYLTLCGDKHVSVGVRLPLAPLNGTLHTQAATLLHGLANQLEKGPPTASPKARKPSRAKAMTTKRPSKVRKAVAA